jgi:hypothetical protein
MVAYGEEAPGDGGRDYGGPGIRWDQQSIDVQVAVDLLEAECAGVVLGLAFGPGKILLEKVQQV